MAVATMPRHNPSCTNPRPYAKVEARIRRSARSARAESHGMLSVPYQTNDSDAPPISYSNIPEFRWPWMDAASSNAAEATADKFSLPIAFTDGWSTDVRGI